MNLAALIENVADYGFGGVYGTQDPQQITTITNFLEQRYRRVNGRRRWPWTETVNETLTTTANVGTVTYSGLSDVPVAFDSVRIKYGSEYPELEYRDPQDLLDDVHVDPVVGTPEAWTQLDDKIYFYPIPDKAYTVKLVYFGTPVSIASSPSTTPIWPAQFHDILVVGAAADMARRQRDWEAVNQFESQFEMRVAEMARSLGLNQRQDSHHVKTGFWDNMRSRG